MEGPPPVRARRLRSRRHDRCGSPLGPRRGVPGGERLLERHRTAPRREPESGSADDHAVTILDGDAHAAVVGVDDVGPPEHNLVARDSTRE